MALINLKIFSEKLGMQTTANVVIPQKNTDGEIGVSNNVKDGKFKCLYLLHGLSDDYTIWMRRTSIERYASEYGICVVMPDGARSFYSDMKYGLKYYSYIAKELPQIIEGMFNVSDQREDRYIGGLSMGGYGAIKIALEEQGRYAAAFGLSPVADIKNKTFAEELVPIFGDSIPNDADIFYLTAKHDRDKVKPQIYLTIGKDDFLYDDNVRLNNHLKNLNYDYTYSETPGAHSWELWDKTVQDALAWMLK